MPVTIYDVAKHLGLRTDASGRASGAEFERLKLPLWGGCQECEASLAAYNMYPSKTGYCRCKDCIDNLGFDSAEAFVQWDKEQQ